MAHANVAANNKATTILQTRTTMAKDPAATAIWVVTHEV